MSQFFQTMTTNLVGRVTNRKLEGRDYSVVPMIMMVEGVLNGSNGPLYYPAEELAKVPVVWNHKPVVVYHPQMNGKALSACDPDVIETHKIGIIMNTTFDGKRLKAEAWLEKDRISLIDNRIQDALDRGEMMEVSTGLYTENEEVDGEFNGRKYIAIARNYRPDHLAILPDQIGACSIADGAGLLRVNVQNRREMDLVLNHFQIHADQSHEQIRQSIYGTLTKGNEVDVWIEEVFPDYFIYSKNGKLFKQMYELKDMNVVLSGVPVEVKRVVTYETNDMPNNVKGDTMKEKLVNELISNASTHWAETDREFLMGLEEDKLQKLFPVANVENKPVENTPAVTPTENNTPATMESFLGTAPAEIQEVLNEAIQTRTQRRNALIAVITKNKKNVLTAEQLSAMTTNQLEAISALAATEEQKPVSNYAGMAPVVIQNVTTEEPLMVPVINFKE